MSKLNFKSFGNGEPIIILHGLFGMLDNWKSFAKKLSEDYMVYIVDLRNHGRSEHVDSMDYTTMAEDVISFMEEEWIFEARIMGHSMGGKVAMQIAAIDDDLLKQLVVVDIAPQVYEAGHQIIFDALLTAPIDTANERSDIENHLKTFVNDTGVVQFLMKNVSRVPAGGFRWKMNLPIIYKEYQKILQHELTDQKIETNTLFVKGAQSNYITEQSILNINTNFLDVRIETIDDAGHWVHADKPERLMNICKEFFSEV